MTATMNDKMRAAQAQLTELLETNNLTAGMYVRVHGDHLIVGRREEGRQGGSRNDRVRLTRLDNGSYGLSVKRHTGRWERTPFSGSMAAMVQTILEFMQHLVAPY
jgi:hypothetical protein